MIEQLKILTSNYLINLGFTAWASAQILKTLLTFLDTKSFVAERLFGSGGMPSSHSALVCSIAVGMSRKMGFASPEFALALVLAAIVMYDAMGVRRAAGEQAKVLNIMLFNLKKQTNSFLNNRTLSDEVEPIELPLNETDKPLSPEDKELKEFLGHTPLEVLGGALLGILLAMIMPVF